MVYASQVVEMVTNGAFEDITLNLLIFVIGNVDVQIIISYLLALEATGYFIHTEVTISVNRNLLIVKGFEIWYFLAIFIELYSYFLWSFNKLSFQAC